MPSPGLTASRRATAVKRRNKAKQAAAPILPASHLEAMQAAGFEALTWHNFSICVRDSNGDMRQEWVPRELVNWITKQAIQWRTASEGNYDFDGWETISGHSHGGRYRDLHSALGWFVWLADQSKPRNA